MSKGGGSAPSSTVTTQVEKLPVELVPFYKDLLGRGVYESLTGYETYPSRRLADFDPYEAGAQQAYEEMALAGTPESFTESQRTMREVMAGSPYQRALQADEVTEQLGKDVGEYATRRPEFADVDLTSRDFTTAAEQDQYLLAQDDLARSDIELDKFSDEGVLGSYMNPYQQTFIDRQKRLARDESEKGANQIAAQAAMSGGLGGYREGIMQSERERNLGEQLQDIQSRGDMENYMQARQAFDADRASDFQRQQANLQMGLQYGEANRQAGFQDIGQARQQFEQDRLADMQRAEFNRQGLREQADIAMRGFDTLGRDVDRRSAAAGQAAGFAGTRQAMEYDRLGQLEAAGQRRRGLAQQGLDMGYQDFLRQQAFPREQLNLYSGLLRGVPVGPGQYGAVYGNQPTASQQLIGAGISGVGLYNAARGGGGSWGSGWGGGS